MTRDPTETSSSIYNKRRTQPQHDRTPWKSWGHRLYSTAHVLHIDSRMSLDGGVVLKECLMGDRSGAELGILLVYLESARMETKPAQYCFCNIAAVCNSAQVLYMYCTHRSPVIPFLDALNCSCSCMIDCRGTQN